MSRKVAVVLIKACNFHSKHFLIWYTFSEYEDPIRCYPDCCMSIVYFLLGLTLFTRSFNLLVMVHQKKKKPELRGP
jgi:hypothetical protein